MFVCLFLESVVQKRWKVLREKYSVSYRKYHKDGIHPTWPLFASCDFLAPYVNLKTDSAKDNDAEDELVVEEKSPPLRSPFDESMLTQLVKERPILYDKKHEDCRASGLRKKAWIEISRLSGWEVRTLEKRWRVMRDRFVRELRRTKNIESDKQINCSAFFREMLFLASHIKSKRYEAEATDLTFHVSQDTWDRRESSEEDANLQTNQFETCIISEAAKESHLEEDFEIEEQDQYIECFAGENVTDREEFDDTHEITDGEELFDDAYCEETNVEGIAVEEISEEQWFADNSVSAKKHRISADSMEQPSTKRKAQQQSESSSAPSQSTQRLEEIGGADDENILFGRTIGLMLQKYPSHLQTAVKLELLQSLANFDLKHNVTKRC